jgi:hypothetical protein
LNFAKYFIGKENIIKQQGVTSIYVAPILFSTNNLFIHFLPSNENIYFQLVINENEIYEWKTLCTKPFIKNYNIPTAITKIDIKVWNTTSNPTVEEQDFLVDLKKHQKIKKTPKPQSTSTPTPTILPTQPSLIHHIIPTYFTLNGLNLLSLTPNITSFSPDITTYTFTIPTNFCIEGTN